MAFDLETMIRRRQDQLRGRPLTRWEMVRERLPYRETVMDVVWPLVILLLIVAIEFAVFAMIQKAIARDLDGRYAASPLKEWFDMLRSGKGPCCSDADGSAVSDADWRTMNGHYQVRLDVSRVAIAKSYLDGAELPIEGYPPTIDMQWIDVPDDAVITEPNRAGKTMVWPLYGYMGVSIRCFMPGSMG